jgi:hypothetical protein
MDEVFNIKYENNMVRNKVQNIKLHNEMFSSLNNEHLNKFIIYASNNNISGLKLSIFYQIGEINIMFIDTFFIDCCYPLKYTLNWQNYPHTNFDNFNKLDDLDFNLCYKVILNEQGILNLGLFKGMIIENNESQVFKKTAINTNGYHINNNDFNFQIILWEILQSNYSNYKVNKIKSNNFEKIDVGVKHIFYEKLFDKSIYLKYMIKKQSLYCDSCKKEIHNFSEKNPVSLHWEYKGLLHLCNRCYEKKLEKENIRKQYIKRIILLEGKKIVFQKRLKEIRKLDLKIEPNNDINFYKKIINGLITDINKNHKNKICSICYDHYLDKKLAVGSCGHCFHLSCVKSLKSCPICREPNPNFKELFF